jgi:hypothetical protein
MLSAKFSTALVLNYKAGVKIQCPFITDRIMRKIILHKVSDVTRTKMKSYG